MDTPQDIPSRITAAKVVGVDTDPWIYIASAGERGKPDYIVSRTELLQIAKCPHKWLKGWKKEETAAMQAGSLLDCLVLTPQQFDHHYAVFPETYPDSKDGKPKPWNRNATFCKEWEKDQGKRECIKQKELDEAKKARDEFMAHPIIGPFVEHSDMQVMIIGTYTATNGLEIPVKCLIDLAPGPGEFANSLADLKTTEDASPKAWRRSVQSYGYHWQAALELDLWNAARNEQRFEFRHVIQEQVFPFEPGLRLLSAEYIAIGRAGIGNDPGYMGALELYARCLEKNEWPGYDRPDQGFQVFDGWTLTEPDLW